MQIDVDRIWDTLLGRQLVPETCQAAFLVGSTARGWSNKKSDYDVCLVSTEPWSGQECVAVPVPLEPSVVQWHSFRVDNHGWDLSYWTDSQFDQMLAKVSWAEYDHVRANSDDVLAPKEEIYIGRVAACIPLFGEDWVARRRAEIDASAYRSILVTRSLGEADRAVEDALGQLEGGDPHSAVLSTRIAFGHTVDALLEERGEYLSHVPKWRSRRFKEAQPATLSFARYWEVETMQGFDPDDPAKWVNDVLTLCQDLCLKVEV